MYFVIQSCCCCCCWWWWWWWRSDCWVIADAECAFVRLDRRPIIWCRASTLVDVFAAKALSHVVSRRAGAILTRQHRRSVRFHGTRARAISDLLASAACRHIRNRRDNSIALSLSAPAATQINPYLHAHGRRPRTMYMRIRRISIVINKQSKNVIQQKQKFTHAPEWFRRQI